MEHSIEDVTRIARAHRRANLSLALFFLVDALLGVILFMTGPGFSQFLRVVALLINAAIWLYFLWGVYRLAGALRKQHPFVWFICALMPLLQIAILLGLSQQAIRAIREAGFKVGFLGADSRQIREQTKALLSKDAGSGHGQGQVKAHLTKEELADLTRRATSLSTEELVKATTQGHLDYEPDALGVFRDELLRRGTPNAPDRTRPSPEEPRGSDGTGGGN